MTSRIRARRPDHQHELAAGFQRVGGLRQLGDRRALDLLVQLGQFAADRGVAAAHDLGEIGQRVLHAVAGFEHHKRGVDPRQFREPRRAARPALAGKNPSKKNRSVGSAATESAVSTEDAPGHRDHGMAGGADLAHQLEAGIGYQGRAGVRDQRDRGALRQPFQDFRPRHRRVVLVIRLELAEIA